jgi:hypothetical protein
VAFLTRTRRTNFASCWRLPDLDFGRKASAPWLSLSWAASVIGVSVDAGVCGAR